MRKRALTGIEQLLLLVLIILTLLAIFMLFQKVDILEKIRNLPGYGHSSSDNADEEIIIDPETTSTSCKVRVGKLASLSDGGQIKILLCNDLKDIKCSSTIDTKIKIDGQDVEVEQKFDDSIGKISNSRIILNEEMFAVRSELYIEVEKDLPFYSDYSKTQYYLKNLNGSKIVGGDICKEEIVLFKEVCGVQVGSIENNRIMICSFFKDNPSCTFPSFSGLKIDSNEIQREIFWWPVDKTVGFLEDGKISLNKDLFEDSSKIKRVYNPKEISIETVLKNLNGSKMFGDKICRDSVATQ
jgi:hypothetical protein